MYKGCYKVQRLARTFQKNPVAQLNELSKKDIATSKNRPRQLFINNYFSCATDEPCLSGPGPVVTADPITGTTVQMPAAFFFIQEKYMGVLSRGAYLYLSRRFLIKLI